MKEQIEEDYDDGDVEPNDEIDDFDNSLDNLDYGVDPFGDYGNQTNMGKHNDLLKELTNFDPVIQRRIRGWLGLEWDAKIQDYKKTQEAIINEKGARWAIGYLQTYQSKPNIITNINEREFKYMHLDILQVVWMVFPTIEDFDVKNTADWYRLCTELEHSAFLVLAGAGDGKYTKFLGESVHRTESVNFSDRDNMMRQYGQRRQEPRGWFSNIKNRIMGRA